MIIIWLQSSPVFTNVFFTFQPEQAERRLALKATLSKEKETSEKDDNAMLILLSLTYLKAAERLTVAVNRARNLPLADRKGRLGEWLLDL